MPRHNYGTVRPNRAWIISELAKGRFLAEVASDLGISSASISEALNKDREYIRARVEGANARLMRAHGLLVQASLDPHPDTNLVIARVELWRAASWFAEREFPALYGRNKLPVRLISRIIEQLREAQAAGLTRTPIRRDSAPLPLVRRAPKRKKRVEAPVDGGINGGISEQPPLPTIDESKT